VVGETLGLAEDRDRRLRIYTTGGIALRAADGTVVGERAFAGRQGRRLFVRLVAIHEPVPPEDLADDLWDTAWPAAWQVALRALVSKLRSTLAAVGATDAITSRDGTYELRLPAGAWLDIDAAADAIHHAETSLRGGSLADACGWALAARAIATRPLLPREEAEWLDALRRRLVDIRLRALECLAETWLANRDAEAAARDAREAIAIDPFRETAHRLLIRAHLAAGESGAAIQAYVALRDQFREELGVLPSLETSALVNSFASTDARAT
jgi:SARP family transcriptional regulator, regulator of embCAB operon